MAIPAAVIAGAKLAPYIVSTIGRLFGAAPRGDLQKFQRTVYPYMAACAQQTGLNCYAFWFGDIVGVKPDKSYGIVYADVGSIEQSDRILSQKAQTEQFYYVDCARPDDDCVNNPRDLQFIYYGSTSEAVISSVPPSESGDIGLGVSTGAMVTTTPAVQQAGVVDVASNASTWLILAGAGLVVLFITKK